ncbi:Histidine kinase-, DNA gyrase B-, and HSP90-like ATPase [Geosporobacter subterraneus DSM 17957]|uniref:histidine kinase n=1 Tax=Geosporobacter subterraneus DSM 17957 TaxID=1121919 RepID=A0A1M6LNY6_9FIRM|nr:PocR ligand-binding domain-containing protein [Geosporobacter subterraneus]SHJ72911.1 Histidine kinase-, DNA gyrase B-, and HSP90-like ATPase [Geosporobacter subterraneus DSM 17957]
MKDQFLLSDFIDMEILQEILDKFAQSTGMAAVVVDYKGNPISKYSNFSKFCKLIRQDAKCRDGCYQCDARGGLEAARIAKPYIYRCHTGLVDLSVPIIVDGHYRGAILAGQTKIIEEDDIELENIVKPITSWKANPQVVEAFNEIVPQPYEKVEAAAHMMFVIANYIAERGSVNIIQEELNRKNIALMEEMKARTDLEKALKDSELRALQSQVNPHFLFNVLNTIGRLALIEDAQRTQEIVFAFAEMLRYTLKKNMNQLVALEEEVLHIERYLKIQSIRFGSRLRYEMEIEDEIRNYRIPFMILQPFVENAINHGLEPKLGEGRIYVKGYAEENRIIMKIIDNGIGIPEDRLAEILNMQRASSYSNASTGIGIRNARKRLIHCFGVLYDIEISSELGKGTTIIISIPKTMDA